MTADRGSNQLKPGQLDPPIAAILPERSAPAERVPAGEAADVRRCQSLARAQVTSGGYLKGGGSPLSFSAVHLAETHR